MNATQIAKVCHEANRAYCQTIGDNSQPSWEDAPAWQKTSAENGVKFHFTKLDSGEIPMPSESHDAWLKQKADEGWKYGPVKDIEKKEHPCFVPYEQLPLEQKMKDYIFGSICHAFWDAEP